ncbi:hypothetical protein MTR_5g097085 [Medicago truncatula]|uniref:Uncharacterized protein n=1 Tax=Medicago truncatula TaxID=3880 RepID=A0A072URI1_MEDTR|nr:hypothetical protein MTR_5g097085 [Medicago truncatula]
MPQIKAKWKQTPGSVYKPKASRGINIANQKHNWVHPSRKHLKLNDDGSHLLTMVAQLVVG